MVNRMPPYDYEQLDKKCGIKGCKNMTSRVINGVPVCTDCFKKGWGRIPTMPVGKQEKAPLYVSAKEKKAKSK